MNEEKRLDEKVLEKVTGGEISVEELNAAAKFYESFKDNCKRCAKLGGDCPCHDDSREIYHRYKGLTNCPDFITDPIRGTW